MVFLLNIKVVGWKETCFSASPGKTLQNHLSRSQAWIGNVEIGGKHKENTLLSNAFLRENCIFAPQTTFFDGFNVLMSFLAEK